MASNSTFLQIFVSLMLISAAIMAIYPNVRGLTLSNVTFDKGCIVVTGQVQMWFTDAKGDYPRVPNEFYYFNAWWQNQIGRSYCGFTLVSIQWTLLQETQNYDLLGFTATLD
jgi:hypothetical protein